jgi:hypothetical protein
MTAQTTTHRIAAIDAHSGYVWGVTNAESIHQAAVAILNNADGSREYAVESCSRRDVDVSLHLYVVADDLAIDDGQDQATIDAVDGSLYLGSVRSWDVRSK